MSLTLLDQSEVFVDANIIVYHFSGPTEYTDSYARLLQRIEEGKLTGITSTLIIAETRHRLMIIEAASKLQIEPKGVVHYLKHHPLDVKKLTSTQKCQKKSPYSVSRFFLLKLKTSSSATKSKMNMVFSQTMQSHSQ